MKRVSGSGGTGLVGDRAAALLAAYADQLAARGATDTIRLVVLDLDGAESPVGFLLSRGVRLVVESTSSTGPEPLNHGVEHYLQARISYLDQGPPGFRTSSPAGT